MTVLDLTVLALIATGLAAAAMAFFSPRLALAGTGLTDELLSDLSGPATSLRTRFGGEPGQPAREPAVAAFPRAL